MKKFLLVFALVALMVCALAISVSAASQSYASFEVVKDDGTRLTVYTAGIKDLGNGQIYLAETAYTEAPVDNEGTYATLDWSTVVEIDFTVTELFYYNSSKGTYTQYTGGTNGNANGNVTVLKGWSNASTFNTVKKVNTGNAYGFGTGLFKGWQGIETVVFSYPAKTISDDFLMNSSVANLVFDENCQITRCYNNPFANCDNLVSVELPDSFTYLGNSGLFSGCDNLESVKWPSNCPAIPGAAFNDCKKLQFEIPDYITEIKGTAFNNCQSITSVVIPSTVTSIGYNAFSRCSNLTSVVFEEGCSITVLNAHTFDGCAFSEITLPNTVRQMKQNVFASNPNLKVINLGASFVDFNLDGNATSSLNCSSIEVLYLPSTFVSTAVRSYIFGGDVKTNDFKNLHPNIVIYYTGTKAAAEAIIAASVKEDGSYVNGIFGTCTLVSLEEYEELKASGEASGRYMVYEYNSCDAFYKGEHTEGVVLNSCQFGCGRNCGQVALLDDPAHQLVTTKTFGENGYFSACTVIEQCTVCATKTIDETINALFVSKGVSAKTFGTDLGLVQGYEVNNAAIEAYKAYAPDFDFGVLAYANVTGGTVTPKPGDDKVVNVVFDKTANNYLEVKITGIPADFLNAPIVFCVYAKDGEKFYYLNDGTTAENVVGYAYNDIIG